MDEAGGVTKRMRKGTKSCLPCRVRKTRCSLPNRNGGPCSECASRGERCTSQGIVAEETLSATNRRLKERVLLLETKLEQLQRDTQRSNVASIDSSASASEALSDLLQTIHGPSSGPASNASPHSHGDSEPKPEEDEVAEEASLGTTSAPLMRLLTNPILGLTPPSSAPPEPCVIIALPGHTATSSASPKTRAALLDLCSALPSEQEMLEIFTRHSSWWSLHRQALGLDWGGSDDHRPQPATLESFAAEALRSGDPAQIGLLLAFFAIAMGSKEGAKFLPPVERRIVSDDGYAGTEAGLHCLMAVGVFYVTALQPRRAWMVYRRGNALMQLGGLHLHHRRDKDKDALFWQFFHADRWCSLMIGLPYSVPDRFCDLEHDGIEVLGPGKYLYQRLTLLTARVIECLQNTKGPSLAASLEVDEQLAALRAQLPRGFLSLESIRACASNDEKHMRLYRVVHFYQLRTYVHLPFLLRSPQEVNGEGQERFAYSRKSCIDDSRRLLEAYLEIADIDVQVVYDGTVLSFTAFTAAVVLLLGLCGHGRPHDGEDNTSSAPYAERDLRIIHRTMDVMRHGAQKKVAALLCKTCFEALQSLMASANALEMGEESRKVVLPYFGMIEIRRQGPYINRSADHLLSTHHTSQSRGVLSSRVPNNESSGLSTNVGVDMSWAYHGPFVSEVVSTNNGYSSMNSSMGGVDWTDILDVNDPDWSWLTADILPSVGF